MRLFQIQHKSSAELVYNPNMKGLILAGGKGSRLFPLTKGINKHLLPIYDKPMIYYPISTLMLAGIREICIVVNPGEKSMFEEFLGNGDKFGISIVYIEQFGSDGIPDAILCAQNALNGDDFVCILGDNIFFGVGLGEAFDFTIDSSKCQINLYRVANPSDFGVAVIDKDLILDLCEKPKIPKSDLAICGLYFFTNEIFEYLPRLKKSPRGEFEIVDLLNILNNQILLNYKILPRGTVWLDAGLPSSMIDASTYVRTVQDRQGLRISCIEEIAFRKGYINKEILENIINNYPESSYKNYLSELFLNES